MTTRITDETDTGLAAFGEPHHVHGDETPSSLSLENFKETSGWAVALLGVVLVHALVVLVLGWGAEFDFLVRFSLPLDAMVPSTAILFALSAAVAITQRIQVSGIIFQIFALAAALIVAIVPAVNMLIMAEGWGSGIDAIFWPVEPIFRTDHMSLPTSLGFLLVALTLFRLPLKRNSDAILVTSATIGGLVSLFALIVFALDMQTLYTIAFFRGLSIPTTLSFLLLFSAILLLRPDLGWGRVIFQEGMGSRSVRRMLPALVGIPLLLVFVSRSLAPMGSFTEELGLALLALATMLLLAISAIRNAILCNEAEHRLVETLQLLEQANADKDVLLREVYHRVKNNLQQVHALIVLEARHVPPETKKAFDQLSTRVMSLAAVHKMLVATETPSSLDLRAFLEELCANIREGTGAENRNIEFAIEAPSLSVTADFAITLGLLINELVTNSLKYAFIGLDAGTIMVNYSVTDTGGAILIVADDGRGFVDEEEARSAHEQSMSTGAGDKILKALVAQLGGKLAIASDQGIRAIITLPKTPTLDS